MIEDAVRLRHVAQTLLVKGRSGEAEPLLRRILSVAPDDVEAHFLLGHLLTATKRYRDALPHLGRFVQAALSGAAQVSAKRARDGIFGFCLSAMTTGESDRVRRLLPLRTHPALKDIIEFFEACLLAGEGDLARAAGLFQAAATGSEYEMIQQGILMQSPDVVQDVMGRPYDAMTSGLPAVEVTVPHRPGNATAPVYLASVDEVYFAEFVPSMLASLRRVEPGALLHAHVVFVDRTNDEARSIAEEGVSRLGINVSWEIVPERRPTSFNCARFVRAPMIWDLYDAPLVICDVDILFKSSPAALLDRDGSDVCLYDYFTFIPWHATYADFVSFRRTPEARTFLEVWSKLVVRLLPETDVWMLDQAALYCVHRTLQEARPDIKVRNVRPDPDFAALFQSVPPGSIEEKRRFLKAFLS